MTGIPASPIETRDPNWLHDGQPDRMADRTLRALDATDAMPPDQRQCVHEFGYAIVAALATVGVTKPNQIRFVVHSIWMGARQPAQRHGRGPGRSSPVAANLDWILLKAGAAITAATLLRVLLSHGMVIVPREPGSVMVDASMDATNHMGVVTKAEKHRNRLRAAIAAAARRLWPQLELPQ